MFDLAFFHLLTQQKLKLTVTFLIVGILVPGYARVDNDGPTLWGFRGKLTSKPTAGKAIDVLIKAGILVEVGERKRDRLYCYEPYLRLLR